jgi:hypothetical protein
MRRIALLLLALMYSATQAANHFIRDGASGSSPCSDWTNACDQFPTLVSGDTYYVADGSYNSVTVDVTNVTVKKCTSGDHGTETGYVSTYCDGQATIDSFVINNDGLTVNGQTRNDSDWSDGNSYGFRITSFTASTSISGAICASNLSVSYVNAGGAPVGDPPTNGVDQVFYIGGFAEYCSSWTLSRLYVHDSKTTFHINGSNGTNLLEYSYITQGWSKESFRGQIAASGWTIRHNTFKDSCQGDYTDPGGSACTGIIAMFDGGPWNDTKIYGNVFWTTNAAPMQDGILVIGGTLENPTGVEIYNNTFAGFEDGNIAILVRGSSGVCRNNLAYDNIGGVGYSCTTTSNNTDAGADPFVSYAGGNFHLSAGTSAGTTLGSPYNVDRDAETRGADGTWDLGAFEFVSGGTPPNAPTNFRLISWLGTILGVGLLLGMWRVYAHRDRWGGGGGTAGAHRSALRPSGNGVGQRETAQVAQG